MYQLSDQQLEYIINDISARGVEMESLQANLIDHICCIIENNLEENGDFESFYQETIKTFYNDSLLEIEEETLLLLTYKNYYTMKKIMINSGITSATFFIIGSFFKFMHWPGASILILLGLAIGALLYLPLLFLFKKNETTESKNKLVLGIGVLNGILFCTYSLFKVMHWPGAITLWFFTLGIFGLIFIPLYFFNGIKNPINKVNTITTTLILIIVAGLFFLQTSLKSNTSMYIAKTYHYLQNEELMLKLKAIKDNESQKKGELINLSNEIEITCGKIKSMIIFDALEQNTIPTNFENTNQWIDESRLSDNFNSGQEGELIVFKLSGLINKYNSLCEANKKLPSTLDKLIKDDLILQSNYNLLSCLSQIELYVILNRK
ncbi:MAG: hypothetical protein IT237_13235 [Bacteroidia bacterium]|nr:hypothetical protein [Bacteroidia bacterium]